MEATMRLDWRLLAFGALLAAVYAFVFLIPHSIDKLALISQVFKNGELWRFLTYQFAHFNLQHLVENSIGVVLLAVLLAELKTGLFDFYSAFFLAGVFAVIPLWAAMSFVAAGASTAIFGGFGLASFEARKLGIKTWAVLAVLFGFAATQLFTGSMESGLSHISGLVFGAGMFFVIAKVKPILNVKKRTILRRCPK
jgi:membrane associated rhomboid family serine protease